MARYLVEITHRPTKQHVEYIEVNARDQIFAAIDAEKEFMTSCKFTPKKGRQLITFGMYPHECKATDCVELEPTIHD